jgi:hypothetical protein
MILENVGTWMGCALEGSLKGRRADEGRGKLATSLDPEECSLSSCMNASVWFVLADGRRRNLVRGPPWFQHYSPSFWYHALLRFKIAKSVSLPKIHSGACDGNVFSVALCWLSMCSACTMGDDNGTTMDRHLLCSACRHTYMGNAIPSVRAQHHSSRVKIGRTKLAGGTIQAMRFPAGEISTAQHDLLAPTNIEKRKHELCQTPPPIEGPGPPAELLHGRCNKLFVGMRPCDRPMW